MKHDNLIAVAFVTASLGLGALVACGRGGEAADAKVPSTTEANPGGAGGTNPATAGKDKAMGTSESNLKGAMGGGTDRAATGTDPGPPATAAPGPNIVDTPKSGPAPTATHHSGPAPKNTGDPPPDPSKHY